MWVDKLKAAQVLSSLNTDTPTYTTVHAPSRTHVLGHV